jgi:hypothetical protein
MTKDDIVRVGEFLTALEAEIKRATLTYWNKCTDLLDGPVEDVCGLCSKFDGLEEEQNAHLSKVFADTKTFVNSLTKVEVSLTKEELERLVLPLEWMDDEDDYGNPAISASYCQYEALITMVSGGMCTLQIRVYGHDDALYTRIGLTVEEAKALAREFQVDYIGSQLITEE